MPATDCRRERVRETILASARFAWIVAVGLVLFWRLEPWSMEVGASSKLCVLALHRTLDCLKRETNKPRGGYRKESRIKHRISGTRKPEAGTKVELSSSLSRYSRLAWVASRDLATGTAYRTAHAQCASALHQREPAGR
eukprot:1843975-Prymnesium_polylepis.1